MKKPSPITFEDYSRRVLKPLSEKMQRESKARRRRDLAECRRLKKAFADGAAITFRVLMPSPSLKVTP